MKITKHGRDFKNEKKKPYEEFKCENCGCEFRCKEDEFYTDFGGADSYGKYDEFGTWATYTISSVIKDYLVCSCPECHKIVKKTHERINKNISVGTNSVITYANTTLPDHDGTTLTSSAENSDLTDNTQPNG